MTTPNSRTALVALVIGHMAGMIDLAALPVWVGALISGYGYTPAEAGALPTGFLLGVVAASFMLSRRFGATRGRLVAPLGYLLAGIGLLAVPLAPAWGMRLFLHVIAGAGVGLGLSTVHGVIGATANPHRVFAFAGLAFGLFAAAFMGVVPQLISSLGAQWFFRVAGGAMLVAALATALYLPSYKLKPAIATIKQRFPSHIRFAIAGIMGMALIQGMVSSFLVPAGTNRGLPEATIQTVLILLGLVNLAPSLLAAVLEKRVRALSVAQVGPLLQGALALSIMLPTGFLGFAVPTIVFAAVMIFTHTFVFGYLAREDRSGRAVAATPAMLMAGSAVAPFLGGILVEFFGFPSVGVAAAAFGLICSGLFTLSAISSRKEDPNEDIATARL